ncbi:unnamed protein product [Diabrotica balteata]|uniref:Uncharacterized protein n=1 Tax=Diabrotica balteata TaxID=107213 RepID=A0A9N9TBE7_DIABA|nr:unnamed protein product [Diabrotica balteata]
MLDLCINNILSDKDDTLAPLNKVHTKCEQTDPLNNVENLREYGTEKTFTVLNPVKLFDDFVTGNSPDGLSHIRQCEVYDNEFQNNIVNISDDSAADETWTPINHNNGCNEIESSEEDIPLSTAHILKRQKMDEGNQTETNGDIPGNVPVIDNETYEDLHSQDQNKTRKRKRNTRRWKSGQAKEKRNSGMSYTNAKGNQVASRSIKPPYNEEKCRLKCTTKVTHDDKKDIFNNYWGMCDINRQREFIVRHVTIIEPKHRYIREGSTRRPSTINKETPTKSSLRRPAVVVKSLTSSDIAAKYNKLLDCRVEIVAYEKKELEQRLQHNSIKHEKEMLLLDVQLEIEREKLKRIKRSDYLIENSKK